METVEKIAMVCHEANRAWCVGNGDASQIDWKDAPQWQRNSAIKGVQFALENPDAADSAQHDAWCADKLAGGWKFGPVKDAGKKEHPCLVSFEELPVFQQAKDKLFRSIVKSLK